MQIFPTTFKWRMHLFTPRYTQHHTLIFPQFSTDYSQQLSKYIKLPLIIPTGIFQYYLGNRRYHSILIIYNQNLTTSKSTIPFSEVDWRQRGGNGTFLACSFTWDKDQTAKATTSLGSSSVRKSQFAYSQQHHLERSSSTRRSGPSHCRYQKPYATSKKHPNRDRP